LYSVLAFLLLLLYISTRHPKRARCHQTLELQL
jgi:hypothetical protein